METKSNNVFVGAVVLGLMVAMVIFAIWLAGLSRGVHKQYDIFFKQSVDGIAKGGAVSFSGVPAGQVTEISLWKQNPEFVRVRISVNEDVPVLLGTTASITSSFTGPSAIKLEGAVKGAPNIVDIGPGGVPVIPAKVAGLGAVLDSAPQLVERLSTLAERLTELVSDKNQASISGILDNVHDLTHTLASQAPEIKLTLQQARVSIKQAGDAADKIGQLAGTTNGLLNDQGKPLLVDLRRTINSANKSMTNLDAAITDMRPGIQTLSGQTIPQATQLVSDLRAMSESLSAVANRLDQGGAAAVLSPPALPDYKPRGK